MKILLLCDHYPLPPRLVNMRNSIKKLNPNAHVEIFAWNRNNVDVVEPDVISLNMDIGYGNQIRKLFNLPKVLKFIKKIVKNGEYDVLHGVDFELAFLASLAKGHAKLIYEVYDIKFFSNGIIDLLRKQAEKYLIRNKVDGLIFASPYFIKYYDSICSKLPKNIIMNNKPLFHRDFNHDSGFMDTYESKIKEKTVITFAGLLRYPEILMNLMDVVVTMEDTVLLLAGDGPAKNELESHAEKIGMKNVVFTGRYASTDLNSIYQITDIIWAAYPNDDKNVRYAVSNKYFESQVFEKKIIVSEDTYLGENVSQNGIGLCVNPYSINDIKQVIDNIRKIHYQNQYNASKFWQDEEEKIGLLYDHVLKERWMVGDSE